MKDFSKWLEAWENYPPVPDWMYTLDLAVVESPYVPRFLDWLSEYAA